MTLKQKLEARCAELGLELAVDFTGESYSLEVFKDGYEIDGSDGIIFYSNNVTGARDDLRRSMLETLSPENGAKIEKIK